MVEKPCGSSRAACYLQRSPRYPPKGPNYDVFIELINNRSQRTYLPGLPTHLPRLLYVGYRRCPALSSTAQHQPFTHLRILYVGKAPGCYAGMRGYGHGINRSTSILEAANGNDERQMLGWWLGTCSHRCWGAARMFTSPRHSREPSAVRQKAD